MGVKGAKLQMITIVCYETLSFQWDIMDTFLNSYKIIENKDDRSHEYHVKLPVQIEPMNYEYLQIVVVQQNVRKRVFFRWS